LNRRDTLFAVLPGTTRQLARRLRVCPQTVRKLLRILIDAGEVEVRILHFGSLAYTRVYQRKEPSPCSTVAGS